MGYLIFILVPLALLAGFFALTQYEARRAARFFAAPRARFDNKVGHIEFILTHVDLSAFLRAETRRIATRIGHDSAHLSLQAVRAAERLLTRAVRRFRTARAVEKAPRESSREFVKVLSDFKGHLDATRPEIPEI
ncbi:MAG: hypothetical protein ACYCPH_02400 [Minisyncoccota bacterium]